MLQRIPNVELLEPTDAHLCCGSAGTYNLEHPETAGELGAAKASNLLATQPDVIVTGNIGCLMQIRTHVGQQRIVPACHTIELLADAYRAS